MPLLAPLPTPLGRLGIRLASSEMQSSHYSDFKISSLPFPGVSVYYNFREKRLHGAPLPSGKIRQRELDGLEEPLLRLAFPLRPGQSWNNYQSWNVVATVQRYLGYIFDTLRSTSPTDGLLIHCVSGSLLCHDHLNQFYTNSCLGWDRTPLFIGIIRILLWAEGLVHQSLDADQILYLVVAYDWLLFGYADYSRVPRFNIHSSFFRHQLVSRLKEGCEIFYFAFWVLQFLSQSEYSLSLRPQNADEGNEPFPCTPV